MTSNHIGSSLSSPTGSRSSSGPMKSHKKNCTRLPRHLSATREKKESAPVIIVSSVRQRTLREFKLYFTGVKKNFNGKRREVKRVIYSHFFLLPCSCDASIRRYCSGRWGAAQCNEDKRRAKGRELRIAAKKKAVDAAAHASRFNLFAALLTLLFILLSSILLVTFAAPLANFDPWIVISALLLHSRLLFIIVPIKTRRERDENYYRKIM